MKKIVFTFIKIIIMASFLTACSPQQNEINEPAVVENSTNAAETEVDGPEITPLRVVFLLPQTMSPFEIDMWNSIDQANVDGIASEIKMIEMKEPTEFEQTIRQVSEEGYDVVISAFFMIKEPFLKVAPDFPDTKYLMIYEAVPEPVSDFPNVQGIVYDVQEGSYVCGVAAAHMTETDQVGFIGGADFPGIVKFLAGYEAGLLSVNPDIQLDIAWAGTFIDPGKGHELALALFERGGDVAMHAANKTGLGLFIAATEQGTYAVGVDVDQTDLAPANIICSALTNPGASVYQSLFDIATDNWSGGTVNWGLDDGVPSAALNKLLLTQEALNAARDAEAAIESGEIEVPTSTDSR